MRYAGVGARQCPPNVLEQITELARAGFAVQIDEDWFRRKDGNAPL